MKLDYLSRFIKSVINAFQMDQNHGDASFIIPSDLIWNHKTFHIH